MQLYRAVIQPVMSFSSLPQGDTLFGAFCWSYRYYYGEEKLEEMLRGMVCGEPNIVFSNAFPSGTLPMPLGIRDTEADFENIEVKAERKKAYQEHKKIKSARFIEREWFEKIKEGDYAGFTKGLRDDGTKEQTVMHNLVSRQENIVKRIDDSGNLFEEDELFTKEDTVFDVYILSSLDETCLKDVFSLMLMLGIGKNKSTGKGAFRLLEWHEETELMNVKRSNAFVALSNFVPAERDPVRGSYKTLVKYGKLDREYAASDEPFKKPVMFLQAGAVFEDSEVRAYYGRCLEHISVRDNVVINAHTIALPMWLNL